MYNECDKKCLIVMILNILKEYSDAEHPLMQKDIQEYLAQDYHMPCDRRSVRSNIISLINLGYDIQTGKGYYMNSREFEDAELHLLIDSVLFSKTLTEQQAKVLIEKLKGLSSRYFDDHSTHISTLPTLQHSDSRQLLYSVDEIRSAIEAEHQVTFHYNTYGTDFKLHLRRAEPWNVNPYEIVANNGKYYLIGNYDKYDTPSYFRIDLMTDVEETETKMKPMSQVRGMENGLNLPKLMAEHIYMFAGESVNVKMKADKSIMTDLIDWFGHEFRILEEESDRIVIRVDCSEQAMFHWAMQYGTHVEVLSPRKLRDEIASAVEGMAGKYLKADEIGEEHHG